MTHEAIQGALYRDIVDALPVALFVLDNRLNVIVANRSASALLATDGREQGRRILDLIPHTGLAKQLRDVQCEGGVREVELHLLSPQGGLKAVKATIVRLETSGIAGPSSLVLLEDISEKIRLEQQLVHSEKLAGMGELAASVAHELGNPLSIMSATLQYMQQRLHAKHDSLAAEMEVILDNLSRMDELLRSLAEFTGPERPHFESHDMQRTLSQVLTFVAKEAEAHQVMLQTEFEPGLTPCWADHRKLKQVFLNLFKNALEAMPVGGRLSVKAKLVRKAAAAEEPNLSIEVSDTGIGIPPGDLDLIFRPFYSTKKGGTGLGLSFCRRVIGEHGGEISVHSQSGRGTTVSIRLPVVPPGRGIDGPAADHPDDRRR